MFAEQCFFIHGSNLAPVKLIGLGRIKKCTIYQHIYISSYKKITMTWKLMHLRTFMFTINYTAYLL